MAEFQFLPADEEFLSEDLVSLLHAQFICVLGIELDRMDTGQHAPLGSVTGKIGEALVDDLGDIVLIVIPWDISIQYGGGLAVLCDDTTEDIAVDDGSDDIVIGIPLCLIPSELQLVVWGGKAEEVACCGVEKFATYVKNHILVLVK